MYKLEDASIKHIPFYLKSKTTLVTGVRPGGAIIPFFK